MEHFVINGDLCPGQYDALYAFFTDELKSLEDINDCNELGCIEEEIEKVKQTLNRIKEYKLANSGEVPTIPSWWQSTTI